LKNNEVIDLLTKTLGGYFILKHPVHILTAMITNSDYFSTRARLFPLPGNANQCSSYIFVLMTYTERGTSNKWNLGKKTRHNVLPTAS